MKWDDLRVFLQVARQNRLVLAAKGLGMDAATVGRRITALEGALGTKLFDRSPQGYEMTEAGRNLVEHAQKIESVVSLAQENVGGQADKVSGIVRIGAPDGVSNYLLTEATAELSRENPDLQIQIVALPRVFSLSQREADLALTVSPPKAGRLKVRKIADYNLHLYGTANLVSQHELKYSEDIGNIPLIGYISDMIFDKKLDYMSIIGHARGANLTSNSLIVQLRWTLAGHGVCILPDFVAQEYPDLVRIFPDETKLTRSFYLVRHQDDDRIARVNRAADLIAAHLRNALGVLNRET